MRTLCAPLGAIDTVDAMNYGRLWLSVAVYDRLWMLRMLCTPWTMWTLRVGWMLMDTVDACGDYGRRQGPEGIKDLGEIKAAHANRYPELLHHATKCLDVGPPLKVAIGGAQGHLKQPKRYTIS